jgi:hypothetical protein
MLKNSIMIQGFILLGFSVLVYFMFSSFKGRNTKEDPLRDFLAKKRKNTNH